MIKEFFLRIEIDMAPVIVKLHLKGHCIETEAKRLLKKLTGQYFEGSGKGNEVLEKVELLQDFIKQSDFARLRTENEKLSGIIESFVSITLDDRGKIILNIE